ncbi:MAG: copper-binding protein [Candidatus Acidiferrales bacterium]
MRIEHADGDNTGCGKFARALRVMLLAAFAAGMLGCGTPRNQAKKYPLKGTITSVNVQGGYVVVDGEAIPGMMGAMKMPYVIRDPKELEKLSAGDTISADIAVTNDGDALENIVVTGKKEASGAAQEK